MNKHDALSNNCSSSAKLEKYLEFKAKNHNHYKCYSNIEKIIAIRNDKALYLCNGVEWNDVVDKNNLNCETGIINFGKCFSFSQEENVAMWMLYGGIDKRGGMIDFTKKGINGILSCDEIELGYFDNNSFVSLTKSSNFEIRIIDMIYYKKTSSGYVITRSNELVKNLKSNIFENLTACKKAFPWNYENECRLIVSVKKEIVPKRCDTVKIDLTNIDVGKSFERLYRAPNYCDPELYNTKPSKLDGEIEWDLCKNCKNRI